MMVIWTGMTAEESKGWIGFGRTGDRAPGEFIAGEERGLSMCFMSMSGRQTSSENILCSAEKCKHGLLFQYALEFSY